MFGMIRVFIECVGANIVRFCANSVDVFVSCGADGSVRMFDLRSLEHSTIIYEPSEKQDSKNCAFLSSYLTQAEYTKLTVFVASLTPSTTNDSHSPTRSGLQSAASTSAAQQTLTNPPPLLRIAASPFDAHLLATFSQDSSVIRVLDVRQPGQALLELKGHAGSVNCIEWSNTQRGLLASGADDCCVLLWDLMSAASNTPGQNAAAVGGPVPTATNANGGATAGAATGVGQERGPSATWECGFEVSNLSWAPSQGALGVCGGRGFWGVQL